MGIFKKLESLFGIVKKEYHKSVNSATFQEHLDQTREIFRNTEQSVEKIGKEVLDRSASLRRGLQNLADNLGKLILNQDTGNPEKTEDLPDEFEEIATRIKSRVDALDHSGDRLTGYVQDIDFEELKQEYSNVIESTSKALIIHKDQVIADLQRESENFDKKLAEIAQDFEKEGNSDGVVYEAKIIRLKEQARDKADELLRAFRKEEEIFNETAAGLKEKVMTQYTTHIDKLNEVSRSITSDFDRLINKMKDNLDNGR